MGTSYRSRLTKPEYVYAGKTGTSQIRTITEEEREKKLKNKSFIDKAPENIVNNEKNKLNDFIVERDKIIDNIAMLK